VSVGYFSQHGSSEHQNVAFLRKLAQQLLLIDWDSLPVERDPTPVTSKYNWASKERYDTLSSYKGYDWMNQSARDWKDYDSLPVFDEDTADVEYALDVLYGWLDGTSRSVLISLVAQYVLPDQPETAERLMNPRRLTDEDVLEAIDNLEAGSDVFPVMNDLFDLMNVS
jgi:hypothetical protein